MTQIVSWVREDPFTWYEKFAVNVIKAGPVPNHVAILMDGNRRYASKHRLEGYGHLVGFNKIPETMQWCLAIGIKELTSYALSIENFKRNEDEVEAFMKLSQKTFDRVFEEKDKLAEKGIRINVIGEIGLLPQYLQKSMARAMLVTKENSNLTVNVAFSYTSYHEMTHSIKQIVKGVEAGDIEPNDINAELINNCLLTKGGPEPDFVFRTSGEHRLSGFQLWQISSAVVTFLALLWPEITLWDFLGAIFVFQRKAHLMQTVKKVLNNNRRPIRDQNKVDRFIQKIEKNYHTQLLNMLNY